MFYALIVMFGCLGLLSACGGENRTQAAGSTQPAVALGEVKTGDGTYYGADGTGACSFDASPGNLEVAALNSPDWGGSSLCGACAEVTGPQGSLRIRIVDLCPECHSGDLDLSQSAFAKIAEPAQGRVPITWQLVACDITGPVRYRYKDGSNPWWTAVQVQNHRLPVTALEVSIDGGVYQNLARENYNYFVTDSGFGTKPVRVRITAQDGQTLEDDLPAVTELKITEGKSQFR